MYDFIFNYFYRLSKKRESSGHRSNAALAVGLAFFGHLFLVWNALKFFFDVNILPFKPLSKDYFYNKLMLMPFALFLGYLFIIFYSHKRAIKIVDSFPTDYNVFSFVEILKVIAIKVVPFLLGIYFLNN